MIRRSKKLNRIISAVAVIIFWFIFPNLYSPKDLNDKETQNLLCVDNSFGMKPPAADGLFMEPKIPSTKWKNYDAMLEGKNSMRIFFHETSGKNQLSIMQCCSIESAAKHNPNRHVQLFIRPPENCHSTLLFPPTPPLYNPVWLNVLSRYPNVSVILLNEKHYFTGTPLEDWYNRKEWRKSQFEIAHLSDYIRILSLYKGGGLYLDMDILTLKPYNVKKFRNFLVYGSALMDHISNGAMHLEYDHWVIEEIMQLLVKEYDPYSYIYHGPEAVSEVMRSSCGLAIGNPKSNRCNDIKLFPDIYFYPIPSIISSLLFQEGNTTHSETLAKIEKSYGVHLWNSLSRFHKAFNIYSNQIVALLAKEHCPLTVSMAKDF
jgi:lactosylceramide 4-alpha-galactosyltransferase